MINKSNMDIAFDIVSASKDAIAFASLWNKLCEMQEYTKEEADNKISSFYTSLLLDGRFINVGDNTWDLRSRYTFDKVTLDVNECYSDDEIEETDPEELEADEEDSEEEEKEDSEYEPEEIE